MVLALLVAVSLVQAPPPLRLVQYVQAVPVGVIEARLADGRFHYRVRHVFRQQERVFEHHWPVDGEGRDERGRLPELWALARRPAEGCVEVREERTGATERLCVEPGGARATLDGVPLKLSYDRTAALVTAEVLDGKGGVLSRFERSDVEPRADADPFGDGFSIGGPAGPMLVVRPGGRLERVAVDGVEQPADAPCLVAARRLASRVRGAVVQLGILVEGARAWPHAWVRQPNGVHVDPTRTADDARAGFYVPFPDEVAGRWYLELASGARQLGFRQ